MSNKVFENYGDDKFKKISRKRTEEITRAGIKKYEFDAVNSKKFYKLVGAEYCYKENGEGGYFYMDNIKIRYNLTQMDLEIEYVVMEYVVVVQDQHIGDMNFVFNLLFNRFNLIIVNSS